MNDFEVNLIVSGLFLLRIALPLLLTLAFGLAMNRLLERWQREM